MTSQNAPTPWDIAKPIFIQYYLDGTITDDMKVPDLYELREEFRDVKKENLKQNFTRIKKTGLPRLKEQQAAAAAKLSRIKEEKVIADAEKKKRKEEKARVRHDMKMYTIAQEIDYWDGSEALCLLKMDIAKKRHDKMKPEHFWRSRPEYLQEFNLTEFRVCAQMEVRRRKQAIDWLTQQMKEQKL